MKVRSDVGIPVDELLGGYRKGWFPMCHPDGKLYWHDPDPRAIIPLDRFEPDARLQQLIRSGKFSTTVDRSFTEVIAACADRTETWIDDCIIASYVELHKAGHAHSVETWLNGRLVGGVYGVAIGAVFFAESMFHRSSNAGKIALASLVERLKNKGFRVLDSQYANDFTARLGAVEIPRSEFQHKLKIALGMIVEPFHFR